MSFKGVSHGFLSQSFVSDPLSWCQERELRENQMVSVTNAQTPLIGGVSRRGPGVARYLLPQVHNQVSNPQMNAQAAFVFRGGVRREASSPQEGKGSKDQ